MSFLLDIFYVFGEAIKNVIFILISIQEMSLKENDKSLSSGSFLFWFIFVAWFAVQFTRAHSQNARSGLSHSFAVPFAHESWRSLHVSVSTSIIMRA